MKAAAQLPPLAAPKQGTPPLAPARGSESRAEVADDEHDERMREALVERATRPVQAKANAAIDTGYGDLIEAARSTHTLMNVQRRAAMAQSPMENAGRVHEAAKLGTSGSANPLSHLEAIQRSFGHHDIRGVEAHTDSNAAAGAKAMDAKAFASGNQPKRAVGPAEGQHAFQTPGAGSAPNPALGVATFRAEGSPITADLRGVAERGFAGRGVPLPYLAQIERSFGAGHDLSRVRAHVGGEAEDASRALSASAYTRGDHIGFRQPPDLRLAAHEAAHVVQQRHGLTLPGGLGTAGDRYERAADAVAERVVAGVPAADLLAPAGDGALGDVVQRQQPTPEQEEADRAVNEMWANVSNIDEVGAEVTFTFFTSNGGITLTGFKRTVVGSGTAASASKANFDTLFKSITTYVGASQRSISFTLKRTKTGWSIGAFDTPSTVGPSPPPEAHTTALPGSPGWRHGNEALSLINPWIPAMSAYAGGPSTIHFTVTYLDDLPTKMELTIGTPNTNQGKGPRFVPADPVGTSVILLNALLSFSEGIGDRQVKFTLEGNVDGSVTRWHVVEAATERGPQPPVPDEATAIMNDYRKTHLENFERTKAVMRTAGMIANFTVEQVAFWMIGGVLIRGFGAVFRLAAPRVVGAIKALSVGGKIGGAEYLETMLLRLGSAERAEFGALAAKADAEGINALSTAERTRLDALWSKVEALFDTALGQAEKDALRVKMSGRLLATSEGAAADAAFNAVNRTYEIHHRLPLEYAHKLPGLDPNTGKNLIAIEERVHRAGVNPIWTRLRNGLDTGKIDKVVVEETVQIIDRNFSHWYNKVPVSSGATLEAEIQAAKSTALAEMDALIARVKVP